MRYPRSRINSQSGAALKEVLTLFLSDFVRRSVVKKSLHDESLFPLAAPNMHAITLSGPFMLAGEEELPVLAVLKTHRASAELYGTRDMATYFIKCLELLGERNPLFLLNLIFIIPKISGNMASGVPVRTPYFILVASRLKHSYQLEPAILENSISEADAVGFLAMLHFIFLCFARTCFFFFVP